VQFLGLYDPLVNVLKRSVAGGFRVTPDEAPDERFGNGSDKGDMVKFSDGHHYSAMPSLPERTAGA
jgi:hypothetical protein